MTTENKESFEIVNNENDKIYCDLRYPNRNRKMPLVLLLHGFMAWKDWGFFPYASTQIANSGSTCITISTSLCGVPDGADDFIYPEKFAANTISREIADINTVIDHFISGNLNADLLEVWSGEIYLVGHSRGGTIAVFIAADDSRIKKVVSWSGIDRFVRYPERQIEELVKIGYFEFKSSRTGKKLRINKTYLDDFKNNQNKYNPKKRVPELDIPLLFIHGEQDMTVPYKESEGLSKLAKNEQSKLYLIKKTGHTFGISHPFKETTKALEEVLRKTISFLNI